MCSHSYIEEETIQVAQELHIQVTGVVQQATMIGIRSGEIVLLQVKLFSGVIKCASY